MLFKMISALSAIWSIAGFTLGLYEKWWMIPIMFVAMWGGLFVIWLISCIIVSRFININKECEKHNPIYRFYANCIIDIVMWYLRIKLHITGSEILPKEKFLLVGNHRGAMDPLICMGVLRKYNMGFVAKKELFSIPIISRLMHTCFCLSLDRENVKEGAKTILRAGQIIKEGKASMGIYPEGTRNVSDEMLPFMHGAFKVAKKGECPIVVATITNTENIMKNAPFKKTHIELDFIGIIDKEFVMEHNTVEISNVAREMMEKHFKEKYQK